MIKVKKVFKRFDNNQEVLKDVNLEVKPGEILVILGESGSGKSVLLKHLIGVMKPDSGTIEIDGKDITQLPEKELLKMRENMGYLFQEGALYDFMTVYENTAFPLEEHTQLKPREIDKKVKDVLKVVGLQDAVWKSPPELSGGMKKRAALARAVILGSKILFCDEPTSGLDPIKSKDIWELIKNISRQLKCTTVVASHDIQNSLRTADRVVLIHDGKIAMAGTPAEWQQSNDPLVKAFLV
jgi:phospholipid/cholesterol/gamma-HCH transport system ATP-binding protein